MNVQDEFGDDDSMEDEAMQHELENIIAHKHILEDNKLVKIFSTSVGIIFAGVSCYYLGQFIFGVWALNGDQSTCWAI